VEEHEFRLLLGFFQGSTDVFELALSPNLTNAPADHLVWLGDAVSFFLVASAGVEDDGIRQNVNSIF